MARGQFGIPDSSPPSPVFLPSRVRIGADGPCGGAPDTGAIHKRPPDHTAMRNATILSALAATLASAAVAQTPNNLIGITRNTPILDQRDHNACTPMPFCAPAFPPAPAVPYAGGTAWDPVRNAAIISNGFLIASVDPITCAFVCPPIPAPTVSPNAMVTGLEMVESQNEIWQLDSFGALSRLTTTCPPVLISVCNTGLPMTPIMASGGLAVDELNGYVFYGYSNFGGGVTNVCVASIANPCLIVQTAIPAPCGAMPLLRGITGLAVDAARQVLYMTDGFQTIGWQYAPAGPGVAFMGQTCCALPPTIPGDQWIGLAVRSGRETSIGAPCAAGSCPACPTSHVLRNSPNLGNGLFALGLDNMALSSFAIAGIGVGPCLTAGPVIAPFCGPIHVALPTITTLGPVFSPMGAGCGASINFPLPLPNNPVFAGLVLSSQCAIFCAGGGNALSNCISFELQSN